MSGHEQPDLHDEIGKRVAAWWWGAPGDDVAGHLSSATLIAPHPIAHAIYMARVADDVSRFREMKEWAYDTALDFVGAKGSGQRKRSLVESFRPDWGRQAARDGLASALWPWRTDEIPGIGKRSEQFKCGKQAYQRVRDEVYGRALELYVGYMHDLSRAWQHTWTRDMIGRWESVTGGDWDKASNN
jgi:hypothetical protein